MLLSVFRIPIDSPRVPKQKFSVYAQQYSMIQATGVEHPDPREQFIANLGHFFLVRTSLNKDDKLILVGEFNPTMEDSDGIQSLQLEFQLTGVLAHRLGHTDINTFVVLGELILLFARLPPSPLWTSVATKQSSTVLNVTIALSFWILLPWHCSATLPSCHHSSCFYAPRGMPLLLEMRAATT
jgi:hypothetical protein